MTTLEATTEIVKAALAGSTGSSLLLTSNASRRDFLTGFEELYKKIKELEADNKTTGKQF